MTIRKISASEIKTDVLENKLTKDELATKYGLPKTEVGRILSKLKLRIVRKNHVTYELVDDLAAPIVQQESIDETIEDDSVNSEE